MHFTTLLVLIPYLTVASSHVILERGGGDGYGGGDKNGGGDNNGGYGGKEDCKQDDCYHAVYNEHATSFCSKYVATKSCELLPILWGYHTESVTSACNCLIHPKTSASPSPVKTTSYHSQSVMTTPSKGPSSSAPKTSAEPSETTKAPSVTPSASTKPTQSEPPASSEPASSSKPSQTPSQAPSSTNPVSTDKQSPSSTKPASTSKPYSSEPATTDKHSPSSTEPAPTKEPSSTMKTSKKDHHPTHEPSASKVGHSSHESGSSDSPKGGW